jgi:DNA-binding response OmpR family regulator
MLRAAGIDRPLLIILPSGGPEEYRAVLDAGADDYLAEPFALNELSRRIHGLVGGSTGTMHIKVGPLSIDPVKHTVRLGGAPLYLTSRKYALLLHLAYNADRPVSREELLDQLCQSEGGPAIRSVRPAAIAVMMSRLREELGEFRWIIGTVRGAGYVLRAVPGK